MTETATVAAPARPTQNPWSLMLSVLVRPTRAFAQLRGRPMILQPLLALWLVNLVVAYLQANQLAQIGARFVESRSLPELYALPHVLGSYTSPLLGGLLNVFLASVATGLLVAGLGAMAGGESRIKEGWSLALYAAVPAQLLAPLVTAAIRLLAPALSVKAGSSLIAVFLPFPPTAGSTYLLYLLDPLHLWSLGLLMAGLVAVMRLPWRKSAMVAGAAYLLVQLVAFTNAAMLAN